MQLLFSFFVFLKVRRRQCQDSPIFKYSAVISLLVESSVNDSLLTYSFSYILLHLQRCLGCQNLAVWIKAMASSSLVRPSAPGTSSVAVYVQLFRCQYELVTTSPMATIFPARKDAGFFVIQSIQVIIPHHCRMKPPLHIHKRYAYQFPRSCQIPRRTRAHITIQPTLSFMWKKGAILLSNASSS